MSSLLKISRARWSVIVAAVVVVGALNMQSALEPEKARAATVLDLAFLASCGICDRCLSDDNAWGHLALTHEDGLRDVDSSEGDCSPQTCGEHPLVSTCPEDTNGGGGGDDGEDIVVGQATPATTLPHLWFAFHNASGDELLALLKVHAQHAEYNAQRDVIQFFSSCNNDIVIAQLPLTRRQITAMAD